jgi:hypothetical protein
VKSGWGWLDALPKSGGNMERNSMMNAQFSMDDRVFVDLDPDVGQIVLCRVADTEPIDENLIYTVTGLVENNVLIQSPQGYTHWVPLNQVRVQEGL